jgi:hypothetical protein
MGRTVVPAAPVPQPAAWGWLPAALASRPAREGPTQDRCCKQLFSKNAISSINLTGCKSNVPDVGLTANIKDVDNMLVVDGLITADDHCLVRIKL